MTPPSFFDRARTAMDATLAWAGRHERGLALATDMGILLCLLLFTFSYLPPTYLLMDSVPTGGDVPAHNYMVSRLQQSIQHGSIISWADGWWAGFPMFQYYFFLPYLCMALLGFVIPVNIAFKIISVIGIYLLPASIYLGFRMVRNTPKTTAPMLAIMSIPYVFVQTHTMWGVNVKSTLAGMIANSMSFCILVIYLGMALRDLQDGKRRPRTALTLIFLFYSHFFTTLIGILVSGSSVFLWGKKWWSRVWVLLPSGIIAVMGAAFWLFPLMAKGSYSVEFGGDWDEILMKTFPSWMQAPFGLPSWTQIPYLLALITPALYYGWKRRSRFVGMFVLMFGTSLILWFVGGRINASFPNIRFWPFLYFAYVCLVGLSIAYLLEFIRYQRVVVVAFMALTLALQSGARDEVSNWFKWNMDGMQGKKAWPTMSEFIDEMKGTEGRFVVDQTSHNNRFGSDRVFEAFPAIIGKPFVVGGIVNSATGSLFTYTVQCEISKGCAGFPQLVSAPRFNPELALKHMDLYSVSHIIGFYPKLQKEMEKFADSWPMVRKVNEYRIYARKGGPTPWVYVPKYYPAYLVTDNWKERAVEWFSVPSLMDRPFVYVEDKDEIEDEKLSLEFDRTAYFAQIAESNADKTEITSWSIVGPFLHPENMKNNEKEPFSWNPTGTEEGAVNPENPVAGLEWKALVKGGAIDVDALMNPRHNMVAYAYSAVYAPETMPVKFLLAVDDEISLFVNGERVTDERRHEIANPAVANATLKKGRNDVVVRVNQRGGGAMFHVRVQTADGERIPDLRFAPDTVPPVQDQPVFQRVSAQCDIDVTKWEDETKTFTTTCPGEPHILKASYFLNWKVKGAEKVYQVSPNFMLVYPKGNEVTLYYGSTFVDVFARIVTFLGYVILGLSFWVYHKTKPAGDPDPPLESDAP
ncbi:MAG: hypothetical protein H6685_09360 [Deltaproteobacteria bacterium]|nr:hypothetical protein [Deltaproteobacteria bacterium]